MKNKKFSIFSWGVLGWNILVILWGAFVRATGSGAGCGKHWPTCNGEIVPFSPETSTIIEFTHRATSGIAMLLVLVMLIWGLRIFPKGNIVRAPIILSAVFINIEALLGASLVLFGWVADDDSTARAIMVALHLANTLVLVAWLTLTAYWSSSSKPIVFTDVHKRDAILLAIGLFGVLLLGMSGAVTALGDTLFPVETLAEGIQQDLQPDAHFLIQLRIIHPIIAVLVGFYTFYVLRAIYQRHNQTIRRLFLGLALALGIQLVAGLVNVLLLVPIPMQLLHLFLADAVWILFVISISELMTSPSALHKKPLEEA